MFVNGGYIKLGTKDVPVEANATLEALKVISPFGDAVHAEEAFSISHFWSTVVATSSAELLLHTSATDLWAAVLVTAGADASVYVMETAVVATQGTALTAFNKNRGGANATSISAYHTPTGAAAGRTLLSGFAPDGVPYGNLAKPTSEGEFLLAQSSAYLVRVTNLGAAAEPIGIAVIVHEV